MISYEIPKKIRQKSKIKGLARYFGVGSDRFTWDSYYRDSGHYSCRLSSVSSTLLQPPQASPATVPDCSPRLRSQTSFPDPRATLQGAQRGVRYRSVAEAEIRMGPELHTLGVGERLAVGEIIVVLETRKDSKLGLLQVRFDRGWAR